ncbi:hypothetical protein ACA910_003691 [Epithemia clementina (nom. ined.)]
MAKGQSKSGGSSDFPPLVPSSSRTKPPPSSQPPVTPGETPKAPPKSALASAPPATEVWEFTITTLLDYKSDSPFADHLRHWLMYHGIDHMPHFLSSWSLPDFTIGSPYMVYCIFGDSTNTEYSLPPTIIKNLYGLYRYIRHVFDTEREFLQDQDMDEDDDVFIDRQFASICLPAFGHHTARSLRHFLVNNPPMDVSQSVPQPYTPPSSRRVSHSSPTTSPLSPAAIQLATFKKGIRREVSAYPVLKDEKYFDSYQRTLLITAQSHSCANVLDPNFVPDKDNDSIELFHEQQVFMFSVFNATLLTDMGKSIVRRHMSTMDAQQVWDSYVTYMKTSSKGATARRELHSYLSTTILDNSWKGTTQQFVLHYQEQFRKLDEISDQSEHIPYAVRLIMLQHAVSPIPDLAMVSTMDEYGLMVSRKGNSPLLNYETYSALLINACIRYDQSKKKNFSKSRNVYHTDIVDTSMDSTLSAYDEPPPDTNVGTPYGGIDLPPEEYFLINTSKTSSSNRSSSSHHGESRRSDTSMRPSSQVKPRYDGPIHLPPEIYSLMSDDAKAKLKKYNDEAIARHRDSKPFPRRANIHDVSMESAAEEPALQLTEAIMDEPDLNNTTVDDPNDFTSTQIDALIQMYQAQFHVNVACTYSISAAKASHFGSLVDRGANGGLAGADVRVLSHSGRKVSVTGIGDHELAGLDLVTCAALANTNHGKVVLIMNEYAYFGQGNTIHSSGQIEYFKNKVDDRSHHVGGKQVIHLLDGYSLPFECRGGLMYMDLIGKPTDEDLEKYPSVMLTSPHDWDPSVLDYSHKTDFGTPEWTPDPNIRDQHDSRLDEFGNYTKRVIQNVFAIAEQDLPSPHSPYSISKHDFIKEPPNYRALRPYFGWVNEDTIKATFEQTTQWGAQITRFPMRKHLKSRFPALNIPRREEAVATDTIFSDTPAVDSGVTMAQVFVGKDSLVADVHPLKSMKQFVNTLEDNIRKRGAPRKLISDYAQVEISNKVVDVLRMYEIAQWHSEPYHQNQNPAEGRYRTIKNWTNTIMNRTGAPANCWLLCMIYVCYLLNHIACAALGGPVPLFVLTGITPDISILLLFQFYQQVFYATHDQSFPSASEERAAYWVGFGEHVGDALTHKLLDAETQKLIYRSAVRPADPAHPNKRLSPDGGELPLSKPTIFVKARQDDNPSVHKPMPEFDPNDYIGKTFLLPVDENGEKLRATVKQKVVEQIEQEDGELCEKINFLLDIGLGRAEAIISYNQLLDHVERSEQEADGIFKFREIIAHQGPLKPGDPDWKGSNYNVQVEWETGEITFEPLSVIAADDPVTCAVYAKKHNLLDEPGWKRFKHLAKRQKTLARQINQSKLRQARRSAIYMFGYCVPRDYKEAMELDKANGNSKWYDAVQLEMSQIREYQVFEDRGKAIYGANKKIENAPKDHHKIRVHLVFAVKHDGRHKARLVADGHLTPEPVESIYSGVVSLRSLRITIFLGKLNDLELWGADIGNAYLEATTDELLFIVAGPEFEELEGHILVFKKALYGLRSSGLKWSQRLYDIMTEMGFSPSKADPCIWMKKNHDGTKYMYIAIYVDDLLIACEDPKSFIDELKNRFGLKIKGDGPLEHHLGCDYFLDPDGTLVASPKKYIEKILETYKTLFNEEPKAVRAPLDKNDHPELDNSDLVSSELIEKYMTMIGQLQWAVSLGRFDILSQVVSMSRFRLASREGHIKRVQWIFGYLAKTKHYAIRYRTKEPDYFGLPEQDYDWTRTIYGNVTELIPDDAPPPLGKSLKITTHMDANLAHDLITGKACTAILHFLNMTPIDWYSKRQATVETATYGSEFTAAKTAVEQIMDLRTTLRYLGVPIQEKTYMFGDNKSVITSGTLPHSLLNKRHNALAYHRVREAVAANIIGFYWIDSKNNQADILSKHWDNASVHPTIKELFDWRGVLSWDHWVNPDKKGSDTI